MDGSPLAPLTVRSQAGLSYPFGSRFQKGAGSRKASAHTRHCVPPRG
jgi:hypothetical protein